MNDNERITEWLGWFKTLENPAIGHVLWQEPDDEDAVWFGLPDFATDLEARERIKAKFLRGGAGFVLNRCTGSLGLRLSVTLDGKAFDERGYDEGALWVEAALHFAKLETKE